MTVQIVDIESDKWYRTVYRMLNITIDFWLSSPSLPIRVNHDWAVVPSERGCRTQRKPPTIPKSPATFPHASCGAGPRENHQPFQSHWQLFHTPCVEQDPEKTTNHPKVTGNFSTRLIWSLCRDETWLAIMHNVFDYKALRRVILSGVLEYNNKIQQWNTTTDSNNGIQQ